MKRELFFVVAALCMACIVACQQTPKGEMSYPHKPVTSAQVYAVICRYPSIFTKEAGRICVML